MAGKNAIVIHHSLSTWGDAKEIDSWHKQRGWSGIGYHYVINNGYPTYRDRASGKLRAEWDGKVEIGRTPDTSIAAAVKEGSMNRLGVHICLIGNFDGEVPSQNQWRALLDLCARLCKKHDIPTDRIFYHRDFAINAQTGRPYKSCPGHKFPERSLLRNQVRTRLGAPETPASKGGVKPQPAKPEPQLVECLPVTVEIDGRKIQGLLPATGQRTYVGVRDLLPNAQYTWSGRELLIVKTAGK